MSKKSPASKKPPSASRRRKRLRIDGESLRVEDLSPIARGEVRLELTGEARKSVVQAQKMVERLLAGEETAYGINTGFGRFCNVRISPRQVRRLQANLVRSHGAGVGPCLSDEQVRLTLAFRANALASGNSGVRPATLDLLLQMYNSDVLPLIPSQGSVGASGDLAPLAHLAQVLIGEGRARVEGKELKGRAALRKVGLEPIRLEAKEGLSLINGVQASSAFLAEALVRARHLFDTADVLGAITLEGLLCSATPFDARIQSVRPHPGQAIVAARMRELLEGSEILDSHIDCDRVQDAYSLRCIPQVHGAGRDALKFVETALITEINAATDNPLVFPEDGEILSGGNFHGAPVGYAADLLAIVVADLAAISERRIERLVNPDLSGLSPFLTRQEGMESGYMMAQVTAASLVSENKVHSHPASVDTVPTSAGTEDHVSMSTIAGRKALQIVENAGWVLGIELLIGLDALETRRPLRSGPALERAVKAARGVLPRQQGDRNLSEEIETAARAVSDGSIATAAKIGR